MHRLSQSIVRRAKRGGRLSGERVATPEAAVTVDPLGCTAHVLQQLAKFDPKMSLPTMRVLLETAKADLRGEHYTIKDLQRALGLRSGTTYKNVRYWVDGNGTTMAAHEMLEVSTDPNDRRRRMINLTPEGRTFMRQLLSGPRQPEAEF